jgi:hypothetical protein
MNSSRQNSARDPITVLLVVANQTETPDATWTAADCDSDELVTETKLPTEPIPTDRDGDGVNDGQEATDGTDPLNSDTDGDG